MGLSIVISGAIIFVALMFTLMNIPHVFDSILSVEEASSEISSLEDSISQTEIRIDSISATAGLSDLTFTLVNDGNEKLWNYDKFDLFITYDADIGGVKTRVTEELINGIPQVGVTIDFDNVTPFFDNCGFPAVQECSFPHEVGVVPGSDRIIIVGVAPKGGETVTSVEYNSLPLTEIRSDDDGGTTASSLWYMLDPPVGIFNVDVRLSSREDVAIGAMSFNNVDQADPIDDDDGLNDGDGISGLDPPTELDYVTSIDDVWIVDVVGTLDGPMTAGGGQTERWDEAQGSTRGAGSTQVTTIPGTYTMDWTNLQAAKEFSISAAALIPAVVGTNQWTVNSITPDILDPGLINNNEQAEISANLSHTIFPGGIVIIKISSDNGVTSSLSAVT